MRTTKFRITYFIFAALMTMFLVACSEDDRGVTPLDTQCTSCIAGLNNAIVDAVGRVKDPTNAEWMQFSVTLNGIGGYSGYNGWSNYPAGQQIVASGELYSSGYNNCGIYPGQPMILTTIEPGIVEYSGPLGQMFYGLKMVVNNNPNVIIEFNDTSVTQVAPGTVNVDYQGRQVPNKLINYVAIFYNGSLCNEFIMD